MTWKVKYLGKVKFISNIYKETTGKKYISHVALVAKLYETLLIHKSGKLLQFVCLCDIVTFYSVLFLLIYKVLTKLCL